MAMLRLHELEWRAGPMEVLRAWPRGARVVMLHSGRVHERWARWSMLAEPMRWLRCWAGRTTWGVVDGGSDGVGAVMPELGARGFRFAHEPMEDLRTAVAESKRVGDARGVDRGEFAGGWIGWFSYDLGRVIEPKAQATGRGRRGRCDRGHAREWGEAWPLIELAWCPSALVFDHLNEAWERVGIEEMDAREERLIEEIDSNLAQAVERDTNREFSLGTMKKEQSRDDVEATIGRVIEYIRAGDLFQANVAQRFSTRNTGDPRLMYAALAAQARPWYGAYLELDEERTLLSASPELFLDVDAVTRKVTTRPIKGTTPASRPASVLAGSEKDRAELNMIVDLMRNDLGRVCTFGSVRVAEARAIETHPTVRHGVATVEGELRVDADFVDLLAATFPPGSVTGAPKIRAMQVIDELEPMRRGPYCGAIGLIGANGAAKLNVAIRTLVREGERTCYSAGGGIVADSNPASEYEEMLAKTAIVAGVMGKDGRDERSHAQSAWASAGAMSANVGGGGGGGGGK